MQGNRLEGEILTTYSLQENVGCTFRLDSTSSQNYFSADQIREFGVAGIVYKQKTILVEGIEQVLLLRNELEGTISLYSGLGRYYCEKGSEIFELQLGAAYAGKNNLIFTRIMSDCEKVQNRLGRQFYNDIKSIRALVISYNNCETPDRNLFENLRLWVLPTIGIEMSILSLSSDNPIIENISGTNILNQNLILPGVKASLRHRNFKGIGLEEGLYYASRDYFTSRQTDQPAQIDEIHFASRSLLSSIIIEADIFVNDHSSLSLKLGSRFPLFTFSSSNYWVGERDYGSEIIISRIAPFEEFKEPTQIVAGIGLDLHLLNGRVASLNATVFKGTKKSSQSPFTYTLKNHGINLSVSLKL